MKYINLAFCLVIFVAAKAQNSGTPVEGVVAVVGSNIVLKSDVEENYKMIQNDPSMSGKLTYCDVLEELLFQKLLVHHAALDSVEVGEEDVENNMDRRLQQMVMQMGGDSKKLEEYYKKSMVEIKEEMRPLVKEQLTAQRMQYAITEGMEVTPTEVQEFFNSLPTDSIPLINTEVEVSQIVKYPEVSKEAEQEAIDKLKDLKERIEEGSSFSSMAILYSEDPGSNKKGGEYKGIKRGQFVKEFEAVAFNLQKMEISDPFKTEYGFHIVQLLEKRGEELDLRHILIKPKLSQQDLEEAKNFLDSVASMIAAGTLTWEEAAKTYSDDEATKFNGGQLSNFETGNTKFEFTQLDRYLYNSIKDLKKGEISTAQFYRENDKEAFRLIRLDNRLEPHKANMKDDFQKLKGFALQKKQNDKMQSWIDDKVDETYIKVNQNYFPNCSVKSRWTEGKSSKL